MSAMSIHSVLFIEGILKPMSYPTTCGLEARFEYPTPKIYRNIKQFDLKGLLTDQENFEGRVDPTFWKDRIIIHMLASPIVVSITFIPLTGMECEILFLQKTDCVPVVTGFVAPYLCKEDRKALGATKEFPACHLVKDESSIDRSLIGSYDYVEEIRPIVKYFLNDTGTIFLGVTCLWKGKLIAQGWVKANS